MGVTQDQNKCLEQSIMMRSKFLSQKKFFFCIEYVKTNFFLNSSVTDKKCFFLNYLLTIIFFYLHLNFFTDK